VGGVHGHANLPASTADLDRLGPVDLFLLAGDTTDRNDIDAFGSVVRTIRARVSAPVWAVFGNNEYAGDHPAYVARFADALGIRFLQDEAAGFQSPTEGARIGPPEATTDTGDSRAHPQRDSGGRAPSEVRPAR